MDARKVEHIIQIVPRRTSAPDGIGDYATLLADALLVQAGMKTIFVQGLKPSSAELRSDAWQDECVRQPDAAALNELLVSLCRSAAPVAAVAHISLYGYQKRGLPFWLIEGLRRWRRQFPGLPLIGIFHELWAGQIRNPLRSSFWLAPAQRILVTRLLAMTDAAITTTEPFADRLRALSRDRSCPINVQNVFSSVGEPEAILPFDQRPRRLAVFGGAGVTWLAEQRGALLRHLVDVYGILEIIDIGKRPGPAPAVFGPARIIEMGSLPAAEVSNLLQTCRLGVLPYGNRAVLGTSTILAAYAAHGVVPVALDLANEDCDGLVAGRHYVVATAPDDSIDHLRTVHSTLHAWYVSHCVAKQAARFGKLIRSSENANHNRTPEAAMLAY